MIYHPRPYQASAIAAGVSYLTDPALKGRHGLIVAPTGSGKSLLAANIALALPGPCVVFQPSKELIEQNAGKLRAYGYEPAVWSDSMGCRERGRVTLATIGSVVRHIEAFHDVEFILVDECHLVNAKGGMYHDFIRLMAHARCLGLTATPYRLASNSFGACLRFQTRTRPRLFTDVVHVTQIGDLSRDGYLAPVDYRVKPAIERTRLKYNTTGGDFTDESIRDEFERSGFAGKLEAEVLSLAQEGRRHILVFTRFQAEAEEITRRLFAAGVSSAVVTADTPDRERAGLVEAFRHGGFQVVANVNVLSTGFDFPALDTVVLARPSLSLAVYYQQVGRAIRPAPDKVSAVVLDLVGLSTQFGPIERLSLERTGKKHDLWAVFSGDRQLTNVSFGQDDKRKRKAAFWGGRRGGKAAAARGPAEAFRW
ncbi:DEAD/DEAH box helicase [bacterium]|nr:DEAD/DEAH box helicase [bacterium]